MAEKIIINNNVAYLICRYKEISKERPCKKTLQKIVYLTQAEGLNLGFEYGIHFYGPYSADLNEAVISLAADRVIYFNYEKMSHFMETNDSLYSIESDLDTAAEEKLNAVIGKYKDKTPSELELITTTHYVKENLPETNLAGIIQGVKKIKGNKYSEKQIEIEYNNL